MARYFLAAHVFYCMTESHAVFLDLKRDAYSALERREAEALGACVRGWPRTARPRPGVSREPIAPSDLIAALENMLAAGLLTADESRGKDAKPVALQPASAAISIAAPQPPAGPRDLQRFIGAWIRTTWMLRVSGLERAVQRVRERSQKAGWYRDDDCFDAATVARLLAIYLDWQPFAFSAIDACLRNSLTLIEFLTRYRIYPTWVFGVRTEPFAAHSWVQQGSLVLNDTVEHVRAYTPIMVI